MDKKPKCGDHATTIIGNLKGMITAELNRFDRMQYGFSYFVNGEAREIWMTSQEFLIEKDKRNTGVGFSNK